MNKPYYVIIDNITGKTVAFGVGDKTKEDLKRERDRLNGGKHNTPPGQPIPALRYTLRKVEDRL